MDVQIIILNLLVNIIPIISATYVIVGIQLFKKTEENKVNNFSFLMFASAIYSFGYFLELNCESLKNLQFVRDFEFLGAVLVPTFGILFIAELTNIKIYKWVKGTLFAVPTILWFIFITNPFTSLFYKHIDLQIVGQLGIAETVKGPAFYFLLLFYASFLTFSSVALLKALKIEKKQKKKQSHLFVLISFQFPWLTVLFILFGFDKYIDRHYSR